MDRVGDGHVRLVPANPAVATLAAAGVGLARLHAPVELLQTRDHVIPGILEIQKLRLTLDVNAGLDQTFDQQPKPWSTGRAMKACRTSATPTSCGR